MNKKTLITGCVILLIVLFLYGKSQKSKAIKAMPGTWVVTQGSHQSQHNLLTKSPHNSDSFMVHVSGGHMSELTVGYFGRVTFGSMKGTWKNGMITWDGGHLQWHKMEHTGQRAQRMPAGPGKPIPHLTYDNGLRSTLLKPDAKPEFKIPAPWTM